MIASLPIQKIAKKSIGHNKFKTTGIELSKDKNKIAQKARSMYVV